jgi:DNA-binding transcriptional LysR family regulator
MATRVPDLALLRSLLLVSESPSIESAARLLGITQSALSYQLKRLEDELPAPVFTVEGRRKVLTHFGRALCDFVREETARLEQGMEAIERAYADPSHLTLRIACRRDRFVQVRSRIEFPGRIDFVAASADDALAALRAHEADIAVCHSRPEVPGLVARPLFSSSPWVICHPRWLPARRRAGGAAWARDPRFLEETPLLAFQEREEFLLRWLRACGTSPARVRPRLACQDWDAIIDWAVRGEGYALAPGDLVEAALARAAGAALMTYPVPEAELAPIVFYAVFHRDLRKTPGFGGALRIHEAL